MALLVACGRVLADSSAVVPPVAGADDVDHAGRASHLECIILAANDLLRLLGQLSALELDTNAGAVKVTLGTALLISVCVYSVIEFGYIA